jgi:hypothetical protein
MIRGPQATRYILVRTKFHEDQVRHSSKIKVITSRICEAVMFVLLKEAYMKYVMRWPRVESYICRSIQEFK